MLVTLTIGTTFLWFFYSKNSNGRKEKHMDGMHEIFTQAILDIFLAVLSLLLAYAVAAVRKFTDKVRTETQNLKNDEQRNLLLDALNDVEELTTKTVTQIEQTTAKALREAVKDGKTDKSELEALSKQAYNEITEALRPEAKELIEKNFGNFSTYLAKTIESKVFELKNAGS